MPLIIIILGMAQMIKMVHNDTGGKNGINYNANCDISYDNNE